VSFGENAVRAIFFDRRISSVKIWGSTNDNRENRVAILLNGIFARVPSTSREKQGKPAELKRVEANTQRNGEQLYRKKQWTHRITVKRKTRIAFPFDA
jgi:hypothetical protein